MMPGFNFTPPTAATPGFNFSPVQPYSPELLAQIAQASFRPPAPMQMPGMQPMQIQQARGAGDIMSGLDALGASLAKGLGGLGGATRTGGDADLGGYSKVAPGGMVDVGGGQMLPNPNGLQYGSDGMPIGPVQPQQSGSIWDRIAQQLKRTGLF